MIEPNRDYPGKSGHIYVFDIEFDDGTVGEFSTISENQTKFTIGKDVKYTAEDLVSKRGDEYVKIDLWKEPYVKNSGGSGGGGRSSGGSGSSNGHGSGGNRGLSPEVEASITMSVCLDQAAVVLLKSEKSGAVKSDLVGLHTIANKFYNHIILQSKGDRQMNINYQSRLKEVTNYLMDFNPPGQSHNPDGLKIQSTDDILKYVDMEVEFLQMTMNKAKS